MNKDAQFNIEGQAYAAVTAHLKAAAALQSLLDGLDSWQRLGAASASLLACSAQLTDCAERILSQVPIVQGGPNG